MNEQPEFSGLKGRFFAWFLTSPLRRVLEWKMGNPDPRLLQLLDLDGGELVVDAGCGSGHHTLMVAERLTTGRVVAIDVSREMLSKLRRNATNRRLTERVEAIEGDALAIPLEDEVADRAISAATWHHLDDPQQACMELARVLRKGGRLVVVDLEVADRHQHGARVKGHHRLFSESDLKRILGAAGLHEIGVEKQGRWLIAAGVKRPS